MDSSITVFISYSWEDEEHNKKVGRFVRRLQDHHINVIYDKNMLLGERITDFMEMIDKSDRVLFICTPKYKEKADLGLGGVKYEKNIITAELYEKGNEIKFIPILFSGTWNESLPIWAKGKLGINYTEESEPEFFKLLYSFEKGHSSAVLDSVNDRGMRENCTVKVAAVHKQNKSYNLIICLGLVIVCFLISSYISNSAIESGTDMESSSQISKSKAINDELVLEDYENHPQDLLKALEPDLRELLKDKYVYFTECFDTIGQSHIYKDGIFMNGFVRGIAPYMGGVLCVDRENYLYVLIIESEETILYYTNNPEAVSVLPVAKFDAAVSYWLDQYNTYHVSFKSDSFTDFSIEGLYVREDAQFEVRLEEDGTISIIGDASSGANMGFIECSTEYKIYEDGGYAKYNVAEADGQYVVFYFGNGHVSVLDRARYLSGNGVSFGGEYFKYKS